MPIRSHSQYLQELVQKSAIPAIASSTAVLVVGAALLVVHDLGALSRHMALHIALMNVIAPVAASVGTQQAGVSRPASLWLAGLAQLVLLWTWHAPPVQRHVVDSQTLQALMHVSLFVVAFGFWRTLLRLPPTARWQSIPVLLLTGKLSCMLAVLLIFAPRLLYRLPSHGAPLSGLEDQQLAGLLMVVACPLSYLVAGLIVTVHAIRDLGIVPGAGTAEKRPTLPAGR